jgi:hypothetical protein
MMESAKKSGDQVVASVAVTVSRGKPKALLPDDWLCVATTVAASPGGRTDPAGKAAAIGNGRRGACLFPSHSFHKSSIGA